MFIRYDLKSKQVSLLGINSAYHERLLAIGRTQVCPPEITKTLDSVPCPSVDIDISLSVHRRFMGRYIQIRSKWKRGATIETLVQTQRERTSNMEELILYYRARAFGRVLLSVSAP